MTAAGQSIQESGWPQYKVLPSGKLIEEAMEDMEVEGGTIQRVRVIAHFVMKWCYDPSLANLNCGWRLWVHDLRVMVRVQ